MGSQGWGWSPRLPRGGLGTPLAGQGAEPPGTTSLSDRHGARRHAPGDAGEVGHDILELLVGDVAEGRVVREGDDGAAVLPAPTWGESKAALSARTSPSSTSASSQALSRLLLMIRKDASQGALWCGQECCDSNDPHYPASAGHHQNASCAASCPARSTDGHGSLCWELL